MESLKIQAPSVGFRFRAASTQMPESRANHRTAVANAINTHRYRATGALPRHNPGGDSQKKMTSSDAYFLYSTTSVSSTRLSATFSFLQVIVPLPLILLTLLLSSLPVYKSHRTFHYLPGSSSTGGKSQSDLGPRDSQDGGQTYSVCNRSYWLRSPETTPSRPLLDSSRPQCLDTHRLYLTVLLL